MQRLLEFLFRYRIFILFLVLEGFCFRIIVRNNNYQGAKYLNSSNRLSASLVSTSDDIKYYFNLDETNADLAEENARLRQKLLDLVDSSLLEHNLLDSTSLGIKAKVIDNSLFFRNNYIIINKGSNDGVQKGMGVLGSDGVVGQVQRLSRNYATVVSLLHGHTLISTRHEPSGTLCSVVWNGESPLTANVEYVPRHISVAVGDSIKTSGFNSVYPEGSLIGVVSEVAIGSESTFYEVKVDLATNFASLSYVYMLELKGKEEIDSLRVINVTENG